MTDRADRTAELLDELGITLAPGLSEAELEAAERRFAFRFADDHRALLEAVLPVGERWPDWRGGDPQALGARLGAPREGVLLNVSLGEFWPESWGERPESEAEALLVAGEQLATWPLLVPVYGHRYLPAAPLGPGAPVFSVMQTDVVLYGANLHEYLRREFESPPEDDEPILVDVPPWSQLALGYPDAEL